MTEIYLLRHGQTQWNKEQIFRGTTDVPLNEAGAREAHLAAEALKGRRVRAVYSSPLSRANQTAEAIARVHGLVVRNLEGLKDVCFGEWQGLSHQLVQDRYPDLYEQWLEVPHRLTFPGGENLTILESRAAGVVREIARNHPEEAVVIVSHRVVNRVVICSLVGIGLSRFWQIGQDTAAINLLTGRSGRFVLTCLNDTCHLRSMDNDRVSVDF